MRNSLPTDVGIAIPFREDPNPAIDRGKLLRIVLAYLAETVPKIPVALVDDPNPNRPFNRAAARNAAVRHAEAESWSVVCILDADTLVPVRPLREAFIEARNGGLHFPFRKVVTVDAPDGPMPGIWAYLWATGGPANRRWTSPGSCYVVRPDAYWDAGGSDELFQNWGGEDAALRLAARGLGIHSRYHPYTGVRQGPEAEAVQLDHGTAADRREHPSYPATVRREGIYRKLVDNRSGMVEWLAVRDDPAAEDVWAARLGVKSPTMAA